MLSGKYLVYRLQGDQKVAAEAVKIAKADTATILYGEAHIGRPDSIDAFLPKGRTGIVGVYPDRAFFESVAKDNSLFDGTGASQRSYVEWMDFIKLADTGEVWANDVLRQQRANPAQRRIIPLTPVK